MTQFDNFKTLFRIRDEYLSLTDFTDKDWYIAQHIYRIYAMPFGYYYLYSHVCQFSVEKQNYIKHILKMCKRYESEEKELFEEMCSDLNLNNIVRETLPYIPSNINSIHTIPYIKTSPKSIDGFTTQIAAIITFEQYREIVRDPKIIQFCLYAVLNNLRREQHSEHIITQIKDSSVSHLHICDPNYATYT